MWHWNGKTWRALPPVGIAGTLRDVVVRSATDVWAVGDWYGTGGSVAVHGNGRAWTTKAPSEGRQAYAAVADPSGGLWAAQARYDLPDRLTLSRYRNGAWTTVHPPAPAGTGQVILRGLARVPGTRTLWAVGGSWDGNGEIIARRTG